MSTRGDDTPEVYECAWVSPGNIRIDVDNLVGCSLRYWTADSVIGMGGSQAPLRTQSTLDEEPDFRHSNLYVREKGA